MEANLSHGILRRKEQRRAGEPENTLTPLNPIHFNPTSLINSAVATASCSGEAAWYNSANESGEFIVMVVAVAIDNQAGTPTPLSFASLAKFS